jgi:hypothetical protein
MCGRMGAGILVGGSIIICMGLESIFGVMVDTLKACTKTIRNMDKESIRGLMVVAMTVLGAKENNMAKASTQKLTALSKQATGKMVNEQIGLLSVSENALLIYCLSLI